MVKPHTAADVTGDKVEREGKRLWLYFQYILRIPGLRFNWQKYVLPASSSKQRRYLLGGPQANLLSSSSWGSVLKYTQSFWNGFKCEIYNYFLEEIFPLSLDLLNGLSWHFYLLLKISQLSCHSSVACDFMFYTFGLWLSGRERIIYRLDTSEVKMEKRWKSLGLIKTWYLNVRIFMQ